MKKLQKYLDRQNLIYAAVLIISLLLIFSRRPDAVLNPQFWAEDGKIWFEQAYHNGIITSIFTPEAGYFQTISRIVAAFSQFFPFEYAPSIFNFSAISAKLLVVFFLSSNRLERLLPDLPARLFAVFIYLALPHSYETHANLTNVQWHLALLSCLIITAVPSEKKVWKIFDYAVIAISAVSGPFCLLLFPVAVIKYWFEKDKRTLILLAILSIGCVIQGISLTVNERPTRAPLGASVKLFMKIVGGHWFAASLVGEKGLAWTLNKPFWKDGVSVIINLAGFGLLIYAFLKSKTELRLLLIFSALIVITALISPAAAGDVPQWSVMWFAPVGSRYWLIPIFSLFLAVFWLARNSPHKIMRHVSTGLLVISLIGIAADWKYQPYTDFEFQKYAARFNEAASGEEVLIPINPNWEMRLVKK